MLFQALWLLLGPANSTSPAHSTTELVLGLAVVAAALFIVAAAVGVSLPLFRSSVPVSAGRARAVVTSRLSDPDAAGRPRSRAPAFSPAL